MNVRPLTAADRAPHQRGRLGVCLIARRADRGLQVALASILRHTPAEHPVAVVAVGEGTEVRNQLSDDDPDRAGRRELFFLDASTELPTAGVNRALECLAPADVALLTTPSLVGEGWLEGIRAAAHADSTTASGCALSDFPPSDFPYPLALHDASTTPLADTTEIPLHDPDIRDFERQAARVREHSLRLHPRLLAIYGPCVYLRRDALELAGPLDHALELDQALEVDFAQRCVLRGLTHVAADDVLVRPVCGVPKASELSPVLGQRYPYLAGSPAVATVRSLDGDLAPTLHRAISAIRRPDHRLSVSLDARALGIALTGTQVHIVELISALAHTEALSLRVVVAPHIGADIRARLENLPQTALLSSDDVDENTAQTDIVHRPQQVFGPADLNLLAILGQRAVVSQLDLIAYRNPGYFPDRGAWERYRRVTRQGLAGADRVVVSSDHTLQDVLADELVDLDRLRIVPPGIDHFLAARGGEAPAPDGGPADPFLLCLGTDFRHKNRVFALALLHELHHRHGWPGSLVFAGTHVPDGSSREEEEAFMARHPELRERVRERGPVDELDKQRMMRGAAAVVYPSIYEGFGLIPFEAAAAGVPCLFAAQTSLGELLPDECAVLVPWNPVLSADRAWALISEPGARLEHLRRVEEAGRQLTWERAAAATLEVYHETILARSPATLGLNRDQVRREHEIDRMRAAHEQEMALQLAEFQRVAQSYWDLLAEVGFARSLIGPHGFLPDELQRALMAMSARPRLSRPLLELAASGYRGVRRVTGRARRSTR